VCTVYIYSLACIQVYTGYQEEKFGHPKTTTVPSILNDVWPMRFMEEEESRELYGHFAHQKIGLSMDQVPRFMCVLFSYFDELCMPRTGIY
jgi:hypothetical protein